MRLPSNNALQLLPTRVRYAVVGLIGVMVVALLQPIVGGLWVRNELRFDYDTLVLCGVLAVIFTRRKVRVLFAREHGEPPAQPDRSPEALARRALTAA